MEQGRRGTGEAYGTGGCRVPVRPMEQGLSGTGTFPRIDAGGGGRWDPISMLFFVPAALCWGKRWGTKPGPMRY